MKFFLTLLLGIGLAGHALAQNPRLHTLAKLKPAQEFDNVHVVPLSSDDKASSFVIWIKKEVPLHKHLHHTEHVYVLKGKGQMRLGSETLNVKKGDVVFIPMDTPHSVKVRKGTLQVVSVQAPKFEGKDRVFLEN